MKKSELLRIIKESIKEIQINEGPMGAAKDCKKCLDNGECCKISGTSSNPVSTCIPCGAERIDMNKGMMGPMG